MSSALAVRGAYGAMRVYRRRKSLYRAARAVRVARAIYPYRGTLKRAYTAVKARAAKRQRFTKTKIGERVGLDNAKRWVARDQQALSINTRAIFSRDLTSIPHTIDNAINGRQRHMVNFRGIKVCMEVRNNLTVPLYFNVAILHTKENTFPGTTKFFRGSYASRTEDFSTTLSALEFHCLPINSDIFTIVSHKRYRLAPANGSADYNSGASNSFINISKYHKIKRQLRWANNGDLGPEGGGIWMVYWCDAYGAAGGTATTANAATIGEHVVSYFKETS